MARTDLALEFADLLLQTDLSAEEFAKKTEYYDKVHLTYLHLRGERASRLIGKPCGMYVTAEIPSLSEAQDGWREVAQCIARPLRQMLPPAGTVLVVGLGNDAITPDALGPQCVRRVLATRHIRGEYARSAGLDDLRPVVTVECGVLGNTGLESGEMVRGLVETVRPCAVIAVDALAARDLHRLGCTVQLGDSGIVPGEGVGNSRKALNRKTLGVPVIAVGIPTVVDAATLISQWCDKPKAGSEQAQQMVVTPREVDLMIRQAARLLATVINAALQPHYDADELTDLAM